MKGQLVALLFVILVSCDCYCSDALGGVVCEILVFPDHNPLLFSLTTETIHLTVMATKMVILRSLALVVTIKIFNVYYCAFSL